jgi:hypothetical protein
MSTLHEYIKEKSELKKYVIDKILDETSGVPLLVHKILFDGRELLSKCKNEQDVDQCVAKLLMDIRAQSTIWDFMEYNRIKHELGHFVPLNL